jgi:hypothetical protein
VNVIHNREWIKYIRIYTFLFMVLWYHSPNDSAAFHSPPIPPPSLPETDPTFSASIIPSFSPTSNPLILLNIPISIKLTSTNYLSWQSRSPSLLHGYGLFKFVSSSAPLPIIIDTQGQIQFNHTYLQWHNQDQLIIGLLRCSLSETILA